MAGKNPGGIVFDRCGYAEDARKEVEVLDNALMHELKKTGVKETPVLWHYARAVNSALMVVKQIERLLFGAREILSGDASADMKKDRDMLLIEALGKAWERWRKAVKDLDEFLPRPVAAANLSLPDRMKPILKMAGGVLEDALAGETAKQTAPEDGEEE